MCRCENYHNVHFFLVFKQSLFIWFDDCQPTADGAFWFKNFNTNMIVLLVYISVRYDALVVDIGRKIQMHKFHLFVYVFFRIIDLDRFIRRNRTFANKKTPDSHRIVAPFWNSVTLKHIENCLRTRSTTYIHNIVIESAKMTKEKTVETDGRSHTRSCDINISRTRLLCTRRPRPLASLVMWYSRIISGRLDRDKSNCAEVDKSKSYFCSNTRVLLWCPIRNW